MGVAGAPETVRRYVAESVAQTGITYFVCDFAFGSLPYAAAACSVELFANEVMPAFSLNKQRTASGSGAGSAPADGV